jgi:CheY-like chemotaxis protein
MARLPPKAVRVCNSIVSSSSRRILVLDLGLPRLDGLDVMQAINAAALPTRNAAELVAARCGPSDIRVIQTAVGQVP